MLKFIKRLMGPRCRHDWKFVQTAKMNEFKKDDEEEEILSSREFSVQRCAVCQKTKYRKL